MRIALIRNGVVENVVEADEDFAPAEGALAVPASTIALERRRKFRARPLSPVPRLTRLSLRVWPGRFLRVVIGQIRPAARENRAGETALRCGRAPITEMHNAARHERKPVPQLPQKGGWPSAPPPVCAKADPERRQRARNSPLDPIGLIARLEDAVEREFARAEAALEKHTPKTIEASARTLATLVKTLAELKRMKCDADSDKGARERIMTRNGADDAHRRAAPRTGRTPRGACSTA